MRSVFLTVLAFVCITRVCGQNPFSNVAIKFPDDVLRNYCGNGGFGAPEIYNPDSLNLVVTYEYGFISPVPDACIKFEKTWYISNADFYNPLLGCITVPNPQPSPSLNNPLNLPGPTISAPGTLNPWNPTVVKIDPLDPLATNYAVFYTGGSYTTSVNGVPTTINVPAMSSVNCLRYRQTIKMIETQAPIINNCPVLPVVSNDSSQNDPRLWNAPYWINPFANGHDLDESSIALSVTATDSCGLNARYLLFLDLDDDGVQESVINSYNLPPAGHVRFGSALTPNYAGGELRKFDQRPGVDSSGYYRFSLRHAAPYGSATNTYSVGWSTLQTPGVHITPELPAGNHRIKWFTSDDCGNESTCDYTFNITNQTTAIGQPAGSTGFYLFPNAPNPFVDETLVRFQLPEPATATLEVRDLTGRLVFIKTAHYAAGRQSIRLVQGEELSGRGPLFCSLRTERYFAVITLLPL